MRSRSPKSATRQRCETQLERLAAIEAGARIGAVRPLAEDASRCSVRVGGVQVGPANADEVAALGITVGANADAAMLAGLARSLAREAARTDALRLLRARARTRHDLVGRLLRKGHERADAAATVERLERAGLIDDRALAADRAERLAAAERLGPRGAEAKLRTLGLSAPLSAEAVAGAYTGVDLLERATGAAVKRAATLPPQLDDQARRRRLYGYLARRGYDHETCRRAIDRALGPGADE